MRKIIIIIFILFLFHALSFSQASLKHIYIDYGTTTKTFDSQFHLGILTDIATSYSKDSLYYKEIVLYDHPKKNSKIHYFNLDFYYEYHSIKDIGFLEIPIDNNYSHIKIWLDDYHDSTLNVRFITPFTENYLTDTAFMMKSYFRIVKDKKSKEDTLCFLRCEKKLEIINGTCDSIFVLSINDVVYEIELHKDTYLQLCHGNGVKDNFFRKIFKRREYFDFSRPRTVQFYSAEIHL